MKKKVLILIHALELGGGAERMASLLLKKFSKVYEPVLLTFNITNKSYPIAGKQFSLRENESFSRVLRTFKLNLSIRPIRLFSFIQKISPDIIISFMTQANLSLITTYILFRIKIPLIITVHTNPVRAYRSSQRYLNPLIKLLYPLKCVSKILTNSYGEKSILIRNYGIPTEKLEVVYNGVDLQEIKRLGEASLPDSDFFLNDKNFVKFITIGRLIELKGHKYLIQAFARVKKRILNAKLLIIGEGPLKHNLRKSIINVGCENDIKILSLQRNPYKYLARSDIFVFSSMLEGFPRVLLEALACGVPIISTNCETGPREILADGKYGFMVEIMNPEDLADKMVLLSKNSHLRERYSNLSKQRAQDFDIDVLISKWIKLINSVIEFKL